MSLKDDHLKSQKVITVICKILVVHKVSSHKVGSSAQNSNGHFVHNSLFVVDRRLLLKVIL